MDAGVLSAVISCIYDAALDPRVWPEAIRRICEFAGGGSANLFWRDQASGFNDVVYSHNFQPHWVQLYNEAYAPMNPLFPAALFRPVGSVTAGSDLVPEEEMRETRFYKEWLAPQGLTDALGVLLEKETTRGTFLIVMWHGGTIDDAARQRLALLVPHLLRAVAIGRLFIQAEAREAALADTLDHVEAGVFLLGRGGRITFANARGQAMLAEGTLVTARNDVLHAVAEEADRALHDALRALEGRAAQDGRRTAIRLSSDPQRMRAAHVLPLTEGTRRMAASAYDAVAAVFVRSSSLADKTPLETLAQLYDLTAGEIRVVGAMLTTGRLDDIAAALGISRATVKTHLNRIYRKCQVAGHGGLIRLVSELGTPQ